MRLSLAIMLLACCAGGCTTVAHPTRGLVKDERQMVQAIVNRVPLGTPIDEARRFMESEGFDCDAYENASFLGRTGIDYVHCSRKMRGFGPYRGPQNDPSWQVGLVYKDGKLVEVLAMMRYSM